MNWHDSQPDPLDDLLQKAHWPDAQPEQLDRLERGWKRTVRRRKILRVAFAAAVILIPTIGIVGLLTIQPNRRPIEQQIAEQPKEASPTIVEPSHPPALASQIVREPNAYELALARLHRKQIAAAKVVAKQSPGPSPEIDHVAAAIQRLMDEPNLKASIVGQELAAKTPNGERRLRRWLQASASSQSKAPDDLAAKRHAALRLLGALGTQESTIQLHAALRNGNCPIEIVEAVARISTIEQLTARARSETVAERQSVWLTSLLERDTPQALGEFLQLVDCPPTSTAALAAARTAKNPPIESLFVALQSQRGSVRVAAARTLGTLNNPSVPKRLIELAMNPATRREALIGLMCSSDPVAKQFLIYAQHDLALAGSVRSISNRYSLVRSVN